MHAVHTENNNNYLKVCACSETAFELFLVPYGNLFCSISLIKLLKYMNNRGQRMTFNSGTKKLHFFI